ncbi:MAG: hypothetical protein ACTSQP_15020 [Promethearchaeota archaeon]
MTLIIFMIANIILLVIGLILIIKDIFDSFSKEDKDIEGKLPHLSGRALGFLLLSFLMLIFASLINLPNLAPK